jgi:hypothetical protein
MLRKSELLKHFDGSTVLTAKALHTTPRNVIKMKEELGFAAIGRIFVYQRDVFWIMVRDEMRRQEKKQ